MIILRSMTSWKSHSRPSGLNARTERTVTYWRLDITKAQATIDRSVTLETVYNTKPRTTASNVFGNVKFSRKLWSTTACERINFPTRNVDNDARRMSLHAKVNYKANTKVPKNSFRDCKRSIIPDEINVNPVKLSTSADKHFSMWSTGTDFCKNAKTTSKYPFKEWNKFEHGLEFLSLDCRL